MTALEEIKEVIAMLSGGLYTTSYENEMVKKLENAKKQLEEEALGS